MSDTKRPWNDEEARRAALYSTCADDGTPLDVREYDTTSRAGAPVHMIERFCPDCGLVQ